MSDPDEPVTEAEPDNAPDRPTEPAKVEPAAADSAETVDTAASAEPAEPAKDSSARPARTKPVTPPRRPRKRRSIGALTKVRIGRSGYQVAVAAVAGLAIIGLSAYAFRDGSGGDDQVTPSGSAPAYEDREVDPTKLTVTETGTLKTDRRTLRVVSARMDLTGKEQLAWAADNGRKVGNVRCTQNFRFNPRETPKERSTTMLCWRTSEQKSVYALAVDLDTTPSDKDLAKTVNDKWTELG